jgi:transposase-like protein
MKEAIDLCKLIEQFGSEEKCREYLTQLRWSDDVVRCPKCNSKTIYRKTIYPIVQRWLYACSSCYYEFSVTTGTILHETHLPLWKWFIATYLLCESRDGVSAHQIGRTLGISYHSAWYLCHRIRAAMAKVDGHKLTGTAGVNEIYVGRERRGHAGRLKKKSAIIGIRELGGHLHFIRANKVNESALHDIIARNVDKAVHVIVIDDSSVDNFNLTRDPSVFSLLKHVIAGTWHQVSAKHLTAYLQEIAWRFSNRANPFAFRDTMIKLIKTPRMECKQLVASQSGSLMSFSWRRKPRQRRIDAGKIPNTQQPF